MWTRCLVCAADLGRNQEVEHFQVGNRLAYDPERGRLWVICPKCARWSLTPLEVRWEALEELERLWETAAARVQGETLALARMRSGLRVVRVGSRPADRELATWRWGTRVRPRHRNVSLVGGAGVVVAAGAAVIVAPQAALIGLGALAYAGFLTTVAGVSGGIPVPLERAGEISNLSRSHIRNAGMNPADDDLGWSIHLERAVVEMTDAKWFGRRQQFGTQRLEWVEFNGEEAVSIARRAFPLLNRRHSGDRLVGDAVDLVAAAGGPGAYLRHAAAEKPRWVKFRHYPEPLRLSLEMVLFQEEERRALEGDLRRLEEAWAEAERIADISDGLLPPKGWDDFRDRVRGSEEE